MKKYTIIFAIFVMISEMAYGQKEPKLLWERDVNIADNGFFMSESSSGLRVSSSGNICAFTYSQVNIFDKDGNRLWGLSDFGKPASGNFRGTNINWVITLDSACIYDKNYLFLKRIPANETNNSWINIFEAEDGFIVGRNDSIIKYDFSVKEVWKYKYREFALRRATAPYIFSSERINNLGITTSYNTLILDEQGKEIFQVDSKSEFKIFQIDSTGFWTGNFHNTISANNYNFFTKEFNFIKYSFEGNKIIEINSKDINQNLDTEYYSTIFLQNGTFMGTYFSNNRDEIFFTKVSFNGNKQTISKKLGNKLSNNFTIGSIKLLDENTVMFSVNDTTGTYFGAAKFDDKNFGSVKSVSAEYSEITGSDFRTYGNFARQLIYHNLDGTVKWVFKCDSIHTWDFKDDFAYITQLGSKSERLTSKIRTSDGKEMWKRPYGEFLSDEQGNDYIRYNQRYGYAAKNFIEFITKDGKNVSKFFEYKNGDVNPYGGSGININFKKKTLTTITLEKIENNNYKSILRKYSTQDSYDSNIRCSEKLPLKIQTVDKSEDCPSVKVKLSNLKREGINYQWQKDGNNLSDKTNDAYSFSESGSYTVVAKDSICKDTVISNVIKITINPSPSAEIKASKNAICGGEKVSITAISNSNIYQWQKDQKDIPDATKTVYEVTKAGTYSLKVKDDNCPKTGYSNVISLVAKPSPEATVTTDVKGVVYEPFTVKMSANTGTGLAYQWLKDDVAIPNETKATYEAKNSGKYNVNVTYDGCSKLSEALTINILIPLSNQEEVGEETVQVYPNPSRGAFKLILPKSMQNAEIQLFDLLGRERTLMYVGEQAQAEGLVQGVYFLRIQRGEKVVTNKIVIE